jgi:aspartate-semialdehyde dehydrogenase
VTGAVGAEFIATMDKRAFRVGKLKALASARSADQLLKGAALNAIQIAELLPQRAMAQSRARNSKQASP